jgi:hypothetical protein
MSKLDRAILLIAGVSDILLGFTVSEDFVAFALILTGIYLLSLWSTEVAEDLQ